MDAYIHTYGDETRGRRHAALESRSLACGNEKYPTAYRHTQDRLEWSQLKLWLWLLLPRNPLSILYIYGTLCHWMVLLVTGHWPRLSIHANHNAHSSLLCLGRTYLGSSRRLRPTNSPAVG